MIELNRIHQGDILEVLRSWPDEFVHCVVTSPPYWGLRDYGVPGQIGLEKTPEEYVAKMVEVFREIRRVLRADGTLWLNLGDSYAASGKGGNPEGSKWKGFVGNKHREKSAMTENNGRPKPPLGLKPKDLCGIPWRVAFALQADGFYLRSDIIWAKPNPMPESVTDRPTKAHEYLFLMAKSGRYYYDAEAIKEEAQTDPHSPGWTSTVRDRNDRSPENKSNKRNWATDGKRNKRSVWSVATHAFPDAHFATFPEKLIEPCILAGAPPQGVVLDPFGGVMTTPLVAIKLDRSFLAIELNKAYCEMGKDRLEREVGTLLNGRFKIVESLSE